jgi:hypothetical protein
MATKGTNASVAARLLKTLKSVDRPGTFCTSGSAAAVLPGLVVEGVGPISLPLLAGQAKALRAACVEAGYGKGTETIVDTNVRRVWKLRPDRFSVENPDWTEHIDKIVADVQRELGLEGQRLGAHLYDLLLYEEGGFFLPHRDGERLDGMVATLIVVLPSDFTGGELVVRHGGREQVIDFSANGPRVRTQYAAFYADCEHEVRPLRSGFRLCLVYNLTLAKAGKVTGAPDSRDQRAKVGTLLRAWKRADVAPSKLAVILDHQYTRNGLSWDALKGIDRSRARLLADAARDEGFHVHLALLSLWESGSVAYTGDDYYGGRRRHRGRSEEAEEEEEAEGESEHEMDELFDSTLTADHWSAVDGSRPAYGAVPVETDEVLPAGALKSVTPDEDYEGYTGNAGMTLERWYRHGAIVLWPDERHFDVMCAAGARQAVPALTEMVTAWKRSTGPDAAARRERCRQFAEIILSEWPEERFRSYRRPPEAGDVFDPTPALRNLRDAQLFAAFMHGAMVRDVTLEPGAGFVEAIAEIGWDVLRDDLSALFDATGHETLERNARLLDRLSTDPARGAAGAGSDARLAVCRDLCGTMAAALARVDAKREPDDWRVGRVDRSTVLAALARAFVSAGAGGALDRAVRHAAAHPNLYPLRDVRVPALLELAAWSNKGPKRPAAPLLLGWLTESAAELASLAAQRPQPPADFRRDANVNCKCADCAELKRFLGDPDAEVHGFRMAQARRDHLESNIRTHQCDLSCQTDRRPRPQVLICTKNTASHERRVKQYEEDLKHLAVLRRFEMKLKSAPAKR